MTTLRELRDELRAGLEAGGVPAVSRETVRFSPPVALIGPGAPYLEAADTYGARLVRLRVRLVVPNAENAPDELDELLEQALPAIEAIGEDEASPYREDARWEVLEAGEPYTLLAGTMSFPAVDVTVTTTAEI